MKINFANFDAHTQSVFNNNTEDFVAFQSLMQDYAQGTLVDVTPKEANTRIVELFRSVLGVDANSRPAEVRKSIRRNQSLVFDILEETIENLIATDWGKGSTFFDALVDHRNLALGQRNEFVVEDQSLVSFMRVSGNNHEIIRQRLGGNRVFSVTTYWIGLKIFADFERLVLGVEDFSKFIAKVYEAYDRFIKDTVYNTFTGYFSSLDSMYKKTGTLTAANLRGLCDNVSISNGGAEVQIYGTRAALRGVTALQNASYISDTQKDEFNTNGLIGTWESYKLIELPQVWAANKPNTKKIDDEMLFVMPVGMNQKPICFVTEGEMYLSNVDNKDTNVDFQYEMELQTKVGCSVMFNQAYGLYDTTAIGG